MKNQLEIREIIFLNAFHKRCHADVVDVKPDWCLDKWYQGSVDGFAIYATSTPVDQFSYIAVKENKR